MARRGQALGLPDAFGHHLVHGDAGGHDARSGVGDTHQFQGALHGTVFTKTAMQGDEAPVKTFLLERCQITLRWIECMRIDAAVAQGFEHALPRHQRNLTLSRASAHQHRHLAC